jgi:hypothetical protein
MELEPMVIDAPISDTSRAKMLDPEQNWPESIKIQLLWRDQVGRAKVATITIEADAFFGRGHYGAPLSGEALIQQIERLRRAGPPKVIRRGHRQQGG